MRNNIELKKCPYCHLDLEHSGHRCQVCGGTGEVYVYLGGDSPFVVIRLFVVLVAFFALLAWAVAG